MRDTGNFFLFGAAAYGKVALDAALLAGWSCLGVFDDDAAKQGCRLLRRFVIDTSRHRMLALAEYNDVHAIFVAIGTGATRRKVLDDLTSSTFSPITICHPGANISPSAILGDAVGVMGGVNIEADAKIGRGTLLNTGSLVAHDCVVGEFCHVAVGATLAGGVRLGNEVFVGAGATIRTDVSICSGVTIGVGAAVVKDITEPGVWVGVPAKPLVKKPA